MSVIAEVSLEVAMHIIDSHIVSRATHRHIIIEIARDIIATYNITEDTEDIDEIVNNAMKSSQKTLKKALDKVIS